MLKKLKSLVPTKRKIVQLYFALLYNANLQGFINGTIFQGKTKSLCVPGLNCYSCPGAIAACPLGSLQSSFHAGRSTIYYVGGILLLYSLLFGRMICGWLCPFGLVQELLYKIKTPKLAKSSLTRILCWIKYFVLVFFVLIIPIMYACRDIPLPAFCKYLCPAGTLEGGMTLLSNAVNESYFSMLGPLFTWKFILTISSLTACIFVFRLFCRFLCPLGALYGLFNKISVFGIQVDHAKCIECGQCVNTCKLDIRHVADAECISCGACMSACPVNAIQWKGSKIHPKSNTCETVVTPKRNVQKFTRYTVLALMLSALIGVMVFSWNNGHTGPSSPNVDTMQPNSLLGSQCPSVQLERIDGSGATGELLDPSATDKITVINFWGTWCMPCINELPYFDRIASEFSDTVTVIAVHSAGSRDTAPEYIKDHFPKSSILFVWETGDQFNGEFYAASGGRGSYPYTLVLDQNGRICQVFLSSVTYEELKATILSLQ